MTIEFSLNNYTHSLILSKSRYILNSYTLRVPMLGKNEYSYTLRVHIYGKSIKTNIRIRSVYMTYYQPTFNHPSPNIRTRSVYVNMYTIRIHDYKNEYLYTERIHISVYGAYTHICTEYQYTLRIHHLKGDT